MDGLSPGIWTETDYVPTDQAFPGPRGRGSAIVGAARRPAWLDALPHAAALIRWRDDAPVFEQWNDPFVRHFGALIEDEGRNRPQWLFDFVAELSGFALSGQNSRRFEIERATALGPEAFACSLAWIEGDRASESRILLSAIDRTADRRIEESLRRELVSDTLTALPNRIGFGETVEIMIEKGGLPPETPISVMILDLMRFGTINQALGTMAGDELILTVAARLNACVGSDYAIARLGGNEFGICHVAENGIADVAKLAERVRAAICKPLRLSNLEISINCAIGCSLLPAGKADADELIRQAHTAARKAKHTDRLEIYRPGELGAARQRFFLESRLRDALVEGNLHLQYQPVIDLSSLNVIGFEALARWTDPEIGAISPNDFIPVAEESGLVVQLGRWALNEAMSQLRRWDEQWGSVVPLKMNVNLSSIQMVRDDVIATITDALESSCVDGRRLMIELTESAVVTDPDNSRNLLEALKRANIAIAMDDFGTGYSNMASLQSLPIDLLKIDRSFVTDMLTDLDKLAIIRAILSLAKTLGMMITAEGIESAEVAAKLHEMGCDFGQGYYFAQSLTADQAYDFWLSRRNSAT